MTDVKMEQVELDAWLEERETARRKAVLDMMEVHTLLKRIMNEAEEYSCSCEDCTACTSLDAIAAMINEFKKEED